MSAAPGTRRHDSAACRAGLQRAGESGESRRGVAQGLSTGAGDLVVAARRALFVARVGDRLPLGAEQAGVLETAEDRIDRSAGQAGGVHDLEAVAKARAHGEEHDAGGVGDARGHGSSIYRTLHRVQRRDRKLYRACTTRLSTAGQIGTYGRPNQPKQPECSLPPSRSRSNCLPPYLHPPLAAWWRSSHALAPRAGSRIPCLRATRRPCASGCQPALGISAGLAATQGLPLGVVGPPRLAARLESVARVGWSQTAGAWAEVIAARSVVPMLGSDPPEPESGEVALVLPFYPGRDWLWPTTELYRAMPSARDWIVHPLSAGADSVYEFSVGDSLDIRLPDKHVIHVREIRVRPRRPSSQLIVGSLWIDAETGNLVRTAYRPSTPIDLWPIMERNFDDDDRARAKNSGRTPARFARSSSTTGCTRVASGCRALA